MNNIFNSVVSSSSQSQYSSEQYEPDSSGSIMSKNCPEKSQSGENGEQQQNERDDIRDSSNFSESVDLSEVDQRESGVISNYQKNSINNIMLNSSKTNTDADHPDKNKIDDEKQKEDKKVVSLQQHCQDTNKSQFKRLQKIQENRPEMETQVNLQRAISFLSQKKEPLKKLYGVFEVHGDTLYYDTRSLFIFSQDICLRKALVWLVNWRWFNHFITVSIILNSIFISLESKENRVNLEYEQSEMDRIIRISGIVFVSIFITEFMLRIIAQGFIFHKKSYMRVDGWNVLDFSIVLISIIELFQTDEDGTFTLIRLLRLLKPLRSIKALKTLRFLISSLVASLIGLVNVCFFLWFVLSIFAILGLNLFSGDQYNACRVTEDVIYPTDGSDPYWPQLDEATHLCYRDEQCKDFSETAVCGNIWIKANLDPVRYDNVRKNELLMYGIPGFDNYFQAMYSVFMVCTLESWVYLMYNFSFANQNFAVSYIFFPVLVFFGAFFAMNLILAQVLDAFNHQHTQMESKKIEEQERERIERDYEASQVQLKLMAEKINSPSKDQNEEGGQISQEIMQMIAAQKDEKSIRQSLNLETSQLQSELMKQALGQHQRRVSVFSPKTNLIRLNSIVLPPIARKTQVQQFQLEIIEQENQSNPEKSSSSDGPSNSSQKSESDQSKSCIDDDKDDGEGEEVKANVIGVIQFSSSSSNNNQQDAAYPDIQVCGAAEPQLILQEMEHSNIQMEETKRNMSQSLTGILDQSAVQIMKEQDERESMPDNNDQIDQDSNRQLMLTNRQTDRHQNIPINNIEIAKIDSKVDETSSIGPGEFFNNNADSRDENLGKKKTASYENTANKSLIDTALVRSQANQVYGFCHKIVIHPAFSIFMLVVIISNAAVLSTYTYYQSESQKKLVQNLDYVFGVVFFIEMIMKLLGLGFRIYFKDCWDSFDGLLVVISFIDYTLQIFFSSDNENLMQALQFVRIFRLLRIMKIARYFKGIVIMLNKTSESVKQMGPFAGLLFLFIFIFALIGRELFAFTIIIDVDGDQVYGRQKIEAYIESGQTIRYPRINFNNFWSSIVAIFTLVNGEDWNQIAENFIRASRNSEGSSEIMATIFFVFLMLFGHLTLFALFTGMLLHNFKQFKLDEEKNLKSVHQLQHAFTFIQEKLGLSRKQMTIGDEERLNQQLEKYYTQDFRMHKSMKQKKKKKKKIKNKKVNKQTDEQRQFTQKIKSRMSQSHSIELDHYNLQVLNFNKNKKFNTGQLKKFLQIDTVELVGESLYIFDQENRFRKLCASIQEHWIFNLVVVLLILSTGVISALESPLKDQNGSLMLTLQKIDYIITGIFTVEAILKVVTYGFVFNGKASYLKSHRNCLDFFILITSLFEISLQTIGNFSGLKTIRIVRLLRPMRLIIGNTSLRSSLMSLVKSVPKILELLTLVILVIFMLAVLQTYLFSGKFNYCFVEHLNINLDFSQKLIRHKWDCLNYGGEWTQPRLNFDTIGESMLALSSIQSHEGWVSMMWASVDATEVNFSPIENNHQFIFVPFSLIVIFIICLLFLNLFVGVVVETFNTQKEILTNNHLLSSAQRTYLLTELLTLQFEPKVTMTNKTNNEIRKFCIDIERNQKFENFILIAILLNTVVLASTYYTASTEFEAVLNGLNIFFMIIFILEAFIKIIALKKTYFQTRWNQFDFVIIVLSLIIMFFIQIGFFSDIGGMTTTIRILRVARMLRLFKRARKLQIIFETLVDAAPTLSSLGFLLLLSIYIFAIIGVQMFSLLQLQAEEGIERELNAVTNFQTFFNSFMTLLRCATGENWNQIMYECAQGEGILYQCKNEESYETIVTDGRDPQSWDGPKGCGSNFGAITYHTIFQITTTQIFLNLFIAIIIDAFIGVSEAYTLPVSRAAVEEFQNIWSHNYDPDGTGYIAIESLEDLLIDLSNSNYANELLSIPLFIQNSQAYRDHFISQLEIPTFQNFQKITFHDTLQKLSMRTVRLNHCKERIIVNTQKILVLERLSGKNPIIFEEHFELLDVDVEYQRHFDQMLVNIKEKGDKIELIKNLRAKTRRLHDMFNHLVDTNADFIDIDDQPRKLEKMNTGPLVMIYTTKHYISARIIIRYWKNYVTRRDFQSQSASAEQIMVVQTASQQQQSSYQQQQQPPQLLYQAQENGENEVQLQQLDDQDFAAVGEDQQLPES